MLGKRLRTVLVAGSLGVATSVFGIAAAAPAHAATCYWNSVGSSSNCDGKDPDSLGSACGSDAVTEYTVQLKDDFGHTTAVWLDLRYSGTCRTVWGRIRNASGPTVYYPSSGCRVIVHRNSDGREYTAAPPLDASNATVWTPVVYDAGVSSYVTGDCDTTDGTSLYFGGTTRSW
jgi:hypothetical protein